jgi:hypothetical protein
LNARLKAALAVVANLGGSLGDAHAQHADAVRGALESPGAEILHRRRPDQRREALTEGRARQADRLRQRIERPLSGRLAMHQRQRLANVRIA